MISIKKRFFENFVALEILNLNNNEINILDDYIFKDLTNLKELHLDNNKICTLNDKTFFGLDNLKVLSLNVNEIVNYYNAFSQLSTLEQLSVNHNKIIYFFSKSFYGLNKLKCLDLSYNQIVYMHVSPLCSGQSNYYQNHLRNLYDDIPSLKVFNLEGNPLYGKPLFEKYLRNLEILNIRETFKVCDDFHSMKDLSYLKWLIINKKEAFKIIADLKSLEMLTLTCSEINEIDANKRQITLNKQITLFNGWPENLRLLDLSNNLIKGLNNNIFISMSNLENLLLNKNKISFIKDKAFNGLGNLKWLDLSNNEITTLSDHMFEQLANLEFVNLEFNLLSNDFKKINLFKNNRNRKDCVVLFDCY